MIANTSWNILSRAGLIWFALMFLHFFVMAFCEFDYAKTPAARIRLKVVQKTLAILLLLAPVSVMLPLGTGWRPYTFESERSAIEAERAIPDDHNAAMLYRPLFKELGPDPELPDFVKNCEKTLLHGPWNTETHLQVADWLRAQSDTIETVMQISEIPQCRFPIRLYFWDSPDRCDQLKYLAKLVLILANLDVTQQNTKATLAKYIAVINMGGHNLQQPTALDFVAGLGLKALALKPARSGGF